MRHLQTILDILRTDGYVVTLPPGIDGIKHAQWIEELPSEKEWEILSQVQPFVFSPGEPFDRTNSARMAEASYKDGYDDFTGFDAPFPVFSVENLDDTPLDFFIMKDGLRRETVAIIVVELLPKQYGYYALCRDPAHPKREYKVFKSNTEGETVQAMLERLNKEKMGIESVRQYVKLGTGKKKLTHRIRRIIHVTPKEYISEYPGGHREVNWTHRFLVRGHWSTFWKDKLLRIVDHSRIGKDRAGNYCVTGYTWVTEFEKGPKELPLITKTRIVE